MAKTKNVRRIKRKTRSIKGGMWPFSSNEPQLQPQQIPSSNVFNDTRLSTQPNEDSNYVDAGIIHATEAVGINMGRAFITGIANAFGSKGIDLSRYDVARTAVLTKLLNNVPNGCKICNIKMDIENSPQSVHVHAYGSLMKLKMTPTMPLTMSTSPLIDNKPPINASKLSFVDNKQPIPTINAPIPPKPNQMQLLPPPPAP
jgi:hypothetical protein